MALGVANKLRRPSVARRPKMRVQQRRGRQFKWKTVPKALAGSVYPAKSKELEGFL